MNKTVRTLAARLLFAIGLISLVHGQGLAQPYTINVSGTFNLSFIAPPAPNSLAGLLGTSFSGSFTTDSDPGSVAADVATRPGEIGWYLAGPGYSLTVDGGVGYPSSGISPATSDDFFISATDAMGLLSDGFYDVFDVEGYAPDFTFSGANCGPLDGLDCGVANGVAYRVTLVGNTDMLSDPARPGPSTIDLSAVLLALVVAEDYTLGNRIGDAYAVGKLSPGSTLTEIDITPIPEPETWALMLAGLGVLCVSARRGRRARIRN
jgi:hypothetical protein